MKPRHVVKFAYNFRIPIYIIVLYSYIICNAGSFDDFFTAIKQDDASTISSLLKRGFDANTPNSAGESGLVLALQESSLKTAAVLIDWPGTNVEQRTPQDESPLMLAALKGWSGLCRQLIDKGADVNKPGWTPLHYAATNGHLEIMSMLLDRYAYIDAASPNGTTPLMMAAHYGTSAAVKLLLEAGADPLLKNDQGLSAIDFAQSANRSDSAGIIAAFIRGLQPKGIW